MEEALNAIGYLTLQELKQLKIQLLQEIALREKREKLVKILSKM
jgi:hypothetical protein